MPQPTAKSALRVALRAQRRAIPPSDRATATDRLATVFLAAHPPASRPLATFIATPEEPDLAPITHAWLDAGLPITLPRVIPEAATPTLAWHEVECLVDLVPGRWGLREPPSTARAATIDDAIMLIPGIAFDRSGARLGMGAGYYDRALEPFRTKTSPLRIGVCLDAFFLPAGSIPTDEHDIPMHAVLTPSALHACPSDA